MGSRPGTGAAVALAAVALVVGSAGTAPALAQEEGVVVGRPDLELTVPDNRLTWNERTSLDVFVSNAGDLVRGGPPEFEERVQTARNVRLDVREDELPPALAGSFEVRTGTVFAGSIPPGAAGPFSFEVEVGSGVPPGVYRIPVEVTYAYTTSVDFGPRREPEYADSTRTFVARVPVVVEDRASFAVDARPQSVPAGDARRYEFTVTNDGTETATDARLRLASPNTSLFFGDLDRPEGVQSAFLGTLAPGESRNVSVRVVADDAAAPGRYPVRAVVRYRNPNGVVVTASPREVGVRVAPEQTFAVRNVSDTLRADGTGVVRGEVVNEGGERVAGAVVVFASESESFRPREREVAVGTLAPGESAPFAFTVDAANDTDPGPRQLSVRVRYRNPEDEVRTGDLLDVPVDVAPEQTFAVRDVVDTVRVDGSGLVRGRVVNTGNRSVSDAVVVLASTSPNLQPREREVAVGTLAPNDSAPFEFRVDTTNATDPGPRQVAFRVRYSDEADERRQSEPLEARLSVAPELAFRVDEVADTLRVGGRGTVRGVLTNTGDDAVTNAVVVLRTNSPNLRPREREVAVGTLDPGEAVPFEFRVDVTNDTDAGLRKLTFRVRYRDAADEPRTSPGVDAQVSVAPELSFAVRDVADTLQVGRSGVVRGVVVNTGEERVRNAVVDYRAGNPTLQPRETEVAVGTLDPGEAVPFEFRVDVTTEAEPGPRQVTFRLRYRDADGEPRRSDPLDARVTVAAERDEFRVEAVNASLAPGGSDVVELRVTNARNETVRDVQAKLFTDDPLSSDSDEAFVPVLRPGETATVRFGVSVAGSAVPKTYPLSVDFSYEDERGDSVLSDTYLVPLEVTEPEDRRTLPTLSPPVLVAAVAAVLLAGLLWWKRRAVVARLP